MNKYKRYLVLLGLLAFAVMLSADEIPLADDLEFLTGEPATEGQDGEPPLDLDLISVSGESLSYQQEVTLRIVRQAYNARRSDRAEDIDKLVCWLTRPTGSYFKRLNCARNGDIWAVRKAPDGRWGRADGLAGYGRIMETTRPVNRWKLEQTLAALPGSSDFDREFLARVMAGEQPPRDIPNDEELDWFANAWVQVDQLYKTGKLEQEQISAIEKEGLSLKRYNRIAELVEIYQSVENQVDERVKKLQ